MNKISICTVCMNRVNHLKETLPVNIRENRHYPDLEFVLLDYNSKDGMQEWVKDNLQEHLASGLLKYYKTTEPEFFSISHSKNMTAKLAQGDIICMVDADNYAGEQYADWVNSIFEAGEGRSIITTLRKDAIPYRDQGGKICVRKDHFHEVSGFDEELLYYGVDDVDLVSRLEQAGGVRFFIEDQKYLQFIGHSDIERVINYALINRLDALYVLQTARMQTENTVLYLYHDNTFSEVRYLYNLQDKKDALSSFGGWGIDTDGFRTGTFSRGKDELQLVFKDGHTTVYKQGGAGLFKQAGGERQQWIRLNEHDEWYIKLVLGFGECMNRKKYLSNELQMKAVNDKGWGRGTVHMNFDVNRSIVL